MTTIPRRFHILCRAILGLAALLASPLLSRPLVAGDAAVQTQPVLPAPAAETAEKKVRQSAALTPQFERIAELNRVQEPELDIEKLREEFGALMSKARSALQAAETPRQKIAALNKVLLADRNVAYLSNKYWRDSTLAASLLRGKGNCLSTSTLYVLAGEALDLPIRMVLIPHHAFVRWDDGAAQINIETTNGGKEIANSEYFSRWSQPDPQDIEKIGWGRSLSRDEAYAELLCAAGTHRAGENRLDEALKLLEQASGLLPNRSDLALQRFQLMANLTGRRDEAREKISAMLNNKKRPLPPSVETGALQFLAADAAGAGDHERERILLLAAFGRAPKSGQLGVLTQLAFCLRALKDYRGAVRYMELALVIRPDDDSMLYNLAILQKNDGRLKEALGTIVAARKINPESWNLQMLEAGYMVMDGQRVEGLQRFEKIERPRGDFEFFECMQAWFYAASTQREKFFEQFERALSSARSTHILEWIDQDPDLDVYRSEQQFRDLVAKHRARLTQSPGKE